jgi:hypothetical protein
VLSGVLADQVDGLVAACPGGTEVRRSAEAGWGAAVVSRPGDAS